MSRRHHILFKKSSSMLPKPLSKPTDSPQKQYEYVLQWRPRSVATAAASIRDPSTVTAEAIRCCTTPKQLVQLWDFHKETITSHGSTSLAAAGNNLILKAFVKAATDWGRKCAIIAEPVLYELAQVEYLDLDDYTSLAVSTCDVNSRRLVDILLDKTTGQKQYVAFYYSLLRCAAEFLRPVDMILAANISKLMADHGIPMYIPHVRVLIHGFGRLAEPPMQAIENIVGKYMEGSLGEPMDVSVLNELLSIFERTRGRHARHAIEILKKIGLDQCRSLVSSVYVRPPDHKPQSDNSFTTVYLVDPYTVPIESIPLPPPLRGKSKKWFVLFLHSAVRGMIEYNGNFPSGNSFLEQKLASIKSLIKREPQHVFVFPADIELQFRANNLRDGYVEDSPNAKYFSILEPFLPPAGDADVGQSPSGPQPQKDEETHMVFVTQNKQLLQQLNERIANGRQQSRQEQFFAVQADFSV